MPAESALLSGCVIGNAVRLSLPILTYAFPLFTAFAIFRPSGRKLQRYGTVMAAAAGLTVSPRGP